MLCMQCTSSDIIHTGHVALAVADEHAPVIDDIVPARHMMHDRQQRQLHFY